MIDRIRMNRTAGLVALFTAAACGGASPPLPAAPAPTAASAQPVAVPAIEPMPSEEAAGVPVSPADPTWGSRTALVTLVEFADFQCPFSARAQATLAQLRTAYGPDDLRVVWKNNPLGFHANARPAAEAAASVFALAGSDAFWKFHDAAFGGQAALGGDSYERWAGDAGVADMAAFSAGLQAHLGAEKVDRDLAEGKEVGVTGTPAFFVNGTLVSGAQPFENFKKTIDQELAKARMVIAAGAPRGAVYVTMSRLNRMNQPAPKAEAADDGKDDDEKEDTRTVFKVPIGTSPALGNPAALVTVVEFSDFQCPFCARVEPTLKAIRVKYGDKLRLVWKNEPLPFHPAAEPAAEAALEVRSAKGDKGFWDVHDKLFASQPGLMSGKDPDLDAIVKIAADAGVPAERIRKAVDGHTHKKVIEADQDLAEVLQANGTPHFFINGRRLIGAQPEEKFDKIIDEEIAKAQALVDKGTRAAAVYDALTRDGKGPPEPEKKDVPRGLPATDPAKGAPRGKVVVHEWADFQCPFCQRVEPTLAQLMKDYGDRVRLVWHDLPLPFHADAPLASQAAREAYAQKGPGGFWTMHDKLFDNQQRIKRVDLDDYARAQSLDMDRWAAALDGAAHAGEVDADRRAGDDAGINGTPTFLIVPAGASSGYLVVGAQSYGRFRRLVERALSEAR